jgi:hypothetical protein
MFSPPYQNEIQTTNLEVRATYPFSKFRSFIWTPRLWQYIPSMIGLLIEISLNEHYLDMQYGPTFSPPTLSIGWCDGESRTSSFPVASLQLLTLARLLFFNLDWTDCSPLKFGV